MQAPEAQWPHQGCQPLGRAAGGTWDLATAAVFAFECFTAVGLRECTLLPVVLLLALQRGPLATGCHPGPRAALSALSLKAQAAAMGAKLMPMICISLQLAHCSSLLCHLFDSSFSCMDNEFNLHILVDSSFLTSLSPAAVWWALPSMAGVAPLRAWPGPPPPPPLADQLMVVIVQKMTVGIGQLV